LSEKAGSRAGPARPGAPTARGFGVKRP
jgi:hypothetical protein